MDFKSSVSEIFRFLAGAHKNFSRFGGAARQTTSRRLVTDAGCQLIANEVSGAAIQSVSGER